MKKEKNIKKREKKEHLFIVIYFWKQESIDKKIIYQLAIFLLVIALYQKKKSLEKNRVSSSKEVDVLFLANSWYTRGVYTWSFS